MLPNISCYEWLDGEFWKSYFFVINIGEYGTRQTKIEVVIIINSKNDMGFTLHVFVELK